MQKNKSICLALSILLIGILNGCGDKELVCLYDEIVPMEKVVQEDMECNRVGIYVDSTPSMEGYIGWHKSQTDTEYPNASSQQEKEYKKYVPITVFNQCLDVLNNIVVGNYDEGNVNYYSINTTLWETKINVLEEAKFRRYYGDSNDKNDAENKYTMVEGYAEKYSSKYDNPSISYAIENAMQDDFAIIITDLYENVGNANAVIRQLKKIKEQANMQKGIGLIGIQSEFAGIIYDLPDNSTMKHGVVDDNKTFTSEDVRFRPFYILLIGNSKQINNFIQEFEKNIEEIKFEKYIWNNQEISGLDYRDYAEYKINALYEMPIAEIGIKNKVNGEKLKQKVVEIDESKIEDKERIYLFYNVSSDSIERFLRENSNDNNLEIYVNNETISVVKVNDFEVETSCLYEYKGEDTKTEVSDGMQKALEIKELYWSKSTSQIVIEMEMQKRWITSGTYVYAVDINKNIEKIVPEWIDEWNLPIDSRDGSRTQNLRNICVALNNVFSNEEQKILKMQFYFRTRG